MVGGSSPHHGIGRALVARLSRHSNTSLGSHLPGYGYPLCDPGSSQAAHHPGAFSKPFTSTKYCPGLLFPVTGPHDALHLPCTPRSPGLSSDLGSSQPLCRRNDGGEYDPCRAVPGGRDDCGHHAHPLRPRGYSNDGHAHLDSTRSIEFPALAGRMDDTKSRGQSRRCSTHLGRWHSSNHRFWHRAGYRPPSYLASTGFSAWQPSGGGYVWSCAWHHRAAASR